MYYSIAFSNLLRVCNHHPNQLWDIFMKKKPQNFYSSFPNHISILGLKQPLIHFLRLPRWWGEVRWRGEVAQSSQTLCDPVDCRLLRPWDSPGKNTGVDCHFLLQGIFLDRTRVSCIGGRRFNLWATREALLPRSHPNY